MESSGKNDIFMIIRSVMDNIIMRDCDTNKDCFCDKDEDSRDEEEMRVELLDRCAASHSALQPQFRDKDASTNELENHRNSSEVQRIEHQNSLSLIDNESNNKNIATTTIIPPSITTRMSPKPEKVENNNSNDAGHDFNNTTTIPSMITTTTRVLSSPSSHRMRKKKFSMMMKNRSSPGNLESWMDLSKKLDTYDKTVRVIQYTTRLLAWFLGASNNSSFLSLYRSVANSRKACYVGRSLIEMEKFRSLGIAGLLIAHAKQILKNRTIKSQTTTNEDANDNNNNNDEVEKELTTPISTSQLVPELYRSMSSLSMTSVPKRRLVFSTLKMIGLMGFVAGDHIAFYTGMGVFDKILFDNCNRSRHRSSPERLEAKRERIQIMSTHFSNRSYFYYVLVGLLASTMRYYYYQQKGTLKQAQQALREALNDYDKDDNDNNNNTTTKEDECKCKINKAKAELQDAQKKQFSLMLAMIRRFLDVIVHSDSPGIDLTKYVGLNKTNEGVRCILALISASTVLYKNNFLDE